MIEGFSGDAGNDETKELPWHEEPGEFSSLDVDNGAWSDRRLHQFQGRSMDLKGKRWRQWNYLETRH
jgi:hypothetical protein